VQAAFVLGQYLYAVTNAEVFAAALDASGRPASWTSLGARPGFASSSATVFSSDGRSGFLYLTGGGGGMTGNPGTCWVARLPGNGTLGPFQETSRLEPGPNSHSSTASGGHVYVAGGAWWSGGSFTGTGTDLPFVSVADIRPDGTLAAWRRTAMLPRASSSWRITALGGRLYALAPVGYGSETLIGDLLADGSVAGWRRASAQLDRPYARFGFAAESGRLYVVGGSDFAQDTNAVAVGRIGPDGDVTGWDLSTADRFTGARSEAAVGAGNGNLYLVGGNGFFAHPPSGAFTDTQWATIDPATGHLAPTEEARRPRPPGPALRVRAAAADAGAVVRWDPPIDDGGTPIVAYAIAASQGGVRVEVGGDATSARIGGLENGLAYTFEVTARNAAGEGRGSGQSDLVTPWASATWRPATSMAKQFVARKPFIAGDELFARSYARYLAAPFGADGLPWGQIGPGWEGGNVSATFPRFEAAAARPTGETSACIYYVGGFDAIRTVGTTRVDCVQSDGFAGKWSAPPAISETLTPTRQDGAAIVVEPFLYILGGTHRDQGTSTDLADVSFARFGADGRHGPWSAAAALPEPVATPAVVAHGGSLYVVAPPGSPSAILRATARPDGSLDGWRLSGAPLPAAVAGARAGVLGDFLYVVSPRSPAVLIGRFDPAGGVASWESDADGSFGDPVLDVVTAPGRLYVRSASGLQMAHVEARTGRLLRWR
jgi:hypothetical protein